MPSLLTLRDPLPDRHGRNTHPASRLGKPTRRTAQEVAAAHEVERQALEEKIHEGEKAKQHELATPVGCSPEAAPCSN